jgi:predicted metalloendopeptidase
VGKEHSDPPSQASWGSFSILAESNRDVLHNILENAAKTKTAKGTNIQLIGDFYASCMDEPAIEKAGITPLQPYLQRIAAIKTSKDLPAAIAWMHKNGFPAIFRFGGGPDAKNSNMVIINAGQAGLSLPNKEYYTKMDQRSVEIRSNSTST